MEALKGSKIHAEQPKAKIFSSLEFNFMLIYMVTSDTRVMSPTPGGGENNIASIKGQSFIHYEESRNVGLFSCFQVIADCLYHIGIFLTLIKYNWSINPSAQFYK